MKIIAATCATGTCPTVFEEYEASDHLFVQGYITDVGAPDGEAVVKVPRVLLEEAVNAPRVAI